MKMKLISVLLFFGLVFVLPVAAEAKYRNGEFSEGDRDPPFVCKQVVDPNLNLNKKRNGFSATNLSSPAREYEDATGEQNIIVAFVAFADQTTDEGTSELEEKAKEALFEGEDSANKYFQNVSQGKMSLKGKILSGWRILKNSEEYGYGQSTSDFDNTKVFNDTIVAIDDEVYFPDFTRIIIFVKGEKTYMMGSLGKLGNIESDDGILTLGICWLGERNVDDQYALRHEILHTYGFRHSGAIYLKDDDTCNRLCASQEITKSDDTTWPPLECSTEEYGDGMCVLGHGRGYPSAFIRHKMGCLNDDQILVVTESVTATLIPRSSSLVGIKMIIIKAKDADGTTKTYLFEYFKRLEGFDSSNKTGAKILVRFFNEEEELNDSGTILLLKKKETDESYEPLNLKEEAFCDTENGIEVKWTSESGEEMVEEDSYAELQITLSQKETPSPTPTLIPIPSPTLIPTLPPIPTPSLNPTLPPVPTPEPTVTSEEMTLSVTINGQDATNNIVVARKSWVEVVVEVRNSDGVILQADKISCELTKSNGKKIYKNRPNGIFRFKVGRRGEYILEFEASKEGFQPASFQTSFKAQ